MKYIDILYLLIFNRKKLTEVRCEYLRKKRNEKVKEKYRNQEIYYVIKFPFETLGLATCLRYIISRIRIADNNNWIPVVDMQSVKTMYHEEKEKGKLNTWDFFFKQPGGISLNQIADKDNVIYAASCQADISPDDSMEFLTNEYAIKYWRGLSGKYINLSDGAKKHIEKEAETLLGSCPSKIIGVICRGTDYVDRRAYKHPVQPCADEVIEKLIKVMKNNDYEKIFLATEDERILQKFKDIFGNKLLYIEQQRYSDGKTPLGEREDFAKRTSRYEEGLQYLAAMIILTKCDALLGGRCGITTMAMILSERYEYTYFWNLGRYGIDDYCNQTHLGEKND